MKRTLYGFLTGILFILCFLFHASADAYQTYYLEDVNLELQLPEEIICFTRDIDPTDPNLTLLGLTKEELDELLVSSHVYLDGYDPTKSYEILVSMQESELLNFSLYTNDWLHDFIDQMQEDYQETGLTIFDSEIYNHTQTKYAKLYLSNDQENRSSIQYFTVFGGRTVIITLHVLGDEIPEEQEELIDHIVSSSRFRIEPSNDPTVAEKYVHAETGVTFDILKKWTEAPMTKERDYLDVKLVSDLDQTTNVIVSIEDLYQSEEITKELPFYTKWIYDRQDFDQLVMSRDAAAEIIDCEKEELSLVLYDGKEYFHASKTVTQEVLGAVLDIPCTTLFHCQNGYLVMFQFLGDPKSPLYEDFEKMVTSVIYPPPDYHNEDLVFFGIMKLVGLLLIVFLLRRNSKQKAATHHAKSNTQIQFCGKCGNTILNEHPFCPKCGTKISRE